MARLQTAVIYCQTGNAYSFYVPRDVPLTFSVHRNEDVLVAARRWIEAQGFTIVDVSTFITKFELAVLCEVQKPKNKQLDWESRTNIVHGSGYSSELSVFIQIAHDRITGKGQKY